MEKTLLNTIISKMNAPVPLIGVGLLLLSGCVSKPDYHVQRLRVDAMQTNVGSEASPNWTTAWRVQFMAGLSNGSNDSGDDISVPVLYTASVPNENLNGCPSQDTADVVVIDGPTHRTLLAWHTFPLRDGITYTHQPFFTDTNPPSVCVPETVKIDLDADRPDFESTVDESDEVNNELMVDITGWPQQKVWVEENF